MGTGEPSYYEILGVAENANEDEIKKAFRKLSFVHHPDKNGNTDESTRKFQDINRAYETLSDHNKRQEYDMMRRFGGMGGPGMGGPGMGQGMGGPGMPFMFHPGNPGPDIFSMLFGAGMPGFQMPQNQGPKVFFQTFPMNAGAPQQPFFFTHHPAPGGPQSAPQPHPAPPPQQTPPETIVKALTITLEQAYKGTTVPIEIEKRMYHENQNVSTKETIHVGVPKGMLDGETIILNNCGHMNEAGIRGDVHVVVSIAQHTVFKPQQLDLVMEKTISLRDALCGFQFEINHLSGRIYKLNNPAGHVIKPGTIKTIPGMGMERNGETGCVKIKFNVEFPDAIPEEKAAKIAEVWT